MSSKKVGILIFDILKKNFFFRLVIQVKANIQPKSVFVYYIFNFILNFFFVFLKDDYREEKHRRSSKDYRSTIDDQEHRDVFII